MHIVYELAEYREATGRNEAMMTSEYGLAPRWTNVYIYTIYIYYILQN